MAGMARAATVMRYPRYDPQVNHILDLARAIRKADQIERFDYGDALEHLAGPAADWGLSLIEIILDHEERQRRFSEHWRRWRKTTRKARER